MNQRYQATPTLRRVILGIYWLGLVACSPEDETLQDYPRTAAVLHQTSLSAGEVHYSLYSDARDPQSLSEATVSGQIYAWFESGASVAEVRFFVDDQWVDERTERIAPYSLGGDRGVGQLLAYDTDRLSAGEHTLVVRVRFPGSNPPQEYTVPFTVGPAVPAGRVFYVATDGSDDNDGKQAGRPFKTIGRAAEAVEPGDTVRVASGTYAEAIESLVSGQPGQRITFVSTEKHGAVIDASGDDAAWLNHGSYVDIVNFEVTGSNYIGIHNRGSYVTVRGNHVHHLAAPDCNGANGGAGILHGNYEAHHNAVIGNLVHDILPSEGCTLIHGIYVSNPRAKVLNNIVYNTRGYGIHTWHYATKVTISGNLTLNNGQGGILLGGSEVVMDGAVVTNNVVVDNRVGAGIYELGNIGQNTYRNNLLWNNNINLRDSTKGENTITADPLLVASGDVYRLESNSPAVDQGTERGASELDYDGQVRIAPLDIGPFNLE